MKNFFPSVATIERDVSYITRRSLYLVPEIECFWWCDTTIVFHTGYSFQLVDCFHSDMTYQSTSDRMSYAFLFCLNMESQEFVSLNFFAQYIVRNRIRFLWVYTTQKNVYSFSFKCKAYSAPGVAEVGFGCATAAIDTIGSQTSCQSRSDEA